jgi:hypothetical protein
MKAISLSKYLVFAITLLVLNSCNGGKSDTDGHKDIEGKADPANTGGKLGGSQSEDERMRHKDTVNHDRKDH